MFSPLLMVTICIHRVNVLYIKGYSYVGLHHYKGMEFKVDGITQIDVGNYVL